LLADPAPSLARTDPLAKSFTSGTTLPSALELRQAKT